MKKTKKNSNIKKNLSLLGTSIAMILVACAVLIAIYGKSNYQNSAVKQGNKCSLGSYQVGDRCIVCPAGKYCKDGVNAYNCPAGTGKNSGAAYSTNCGNCPNGSYSTGGSPCRACPSGQTSNSTRTGCVASATKVTPTPITQKSCVSIGTASECTARSDCAWDYTNYCHNKTVIAGTPTPQSKKYYCVMTYNSASQTLTISGSPANEVRKTVIDGRETSTYKITRSGTYSGIVYFANGEQCRASKVVVISSATATPSTKNYPACYQTGSGLIWTDSPQPGWTLLPGITTQADCVSTTPVPSPTATARAITLPIITCLNPVYTGKAQVIAKCANGSISGEVKTNVGNYTVTCRGTDGIATKICPIVSSSKSTATPTASSKTCSLTYNSSTQTLILNASTSDGTTIVSKTIEGREVSTYKVTGNGLYSGSVYFSDGVKCTAYRQVFMPGVTPEPQVPATAPPRPTSTPKAKPSCGELNNETACSLNGCRWINNQCVNKTYSCYRTESGDYIWTNTPQSGWSMVGGVNNRNECVPTGVSNPTSCPSGQYLSGGSCIVCPAGSYCMNSAKYPCPAGFGAASGASYVTQCRACGQNQYSEAGSPCQQCPEGTISNVNGSGCYDKEAGSTETITKEYIETYIITLFDQWRQRGRNN